MIRTVSAANGSEKTIEAEAPSFEKPAETIDGLKQFIEAIIDKTAQARNYSSGVSCASYAASTNPIWAAEAASFIAWRDDVWETAFTELALVEGGKRKPPTPDEVVQMVPEIVWAVK